MKLHKIFLNIPIKLESINLDKQILNKLNIPITKVSVT